jgi:hypothetical protein
MGPGWAVTGVQPTARPVSVPAVSWWSREEPFGATLGQVACASRPRPGDVMGSPGFAAWCGGCCGRMSGIRRVSREDRLGPCWRI